MSSSSAIFSSVSCLSPVSGLGLVGFGLKDEAQAPFTVAVLQEGNCSFGVGPVAARRSAQSMFFCVRLVFRASSGRCSELRVVTTAINVFLIHGHHGLPALSYACCLCTSCSFCSIGTSTEHQHHEAEQWSPPTVPLLLLLLLLLLVLVLVLLLLLLFLLLRRTTTAATTTTSTTTTTITTTTISTTATATTTTTTTTPARSYLHGQKQAVKHAVQQQQQQRMMQAYMQPHRSTSGHFFRMHLLRNLRS